MAPSSTDRLRTLPWEALSGLDGWVLPAVRRVLEGIAAEREIDRVLRAHPELSAEQRAAAVEAVFGVGLWRCRLAVHAGSHEPRALLFALLRDLGGIADQRAAELTGLAPPLPPRLPAPERLADRWSLPDWIEASLLHDFPDEAEALAAAMCSPGPICLRTNTLRISREDLGRALAEEGICTRTTRFAPDGLVVTTTSTLSRPNLFALRGWREGLFEVQDEGSQLVAQLVRARPGETVLDFCAGAGGKTLALACALRGSGRLIASDPDEERLDRLRNRAARAGAAVEIARHPEVQADAVLVDGPCSELGTLRRGPDLRFRLREGDALRFPALQREILEAAMRRVKPGGRLVYATCTLRRKEDEEVASALEAAHPELKRIEPEVPAGLVRGGFLRTFPHLHEMDGFFAAAWHRL